MKAFEKLKIKDKLPRNKDVNRAAGEMGFSDRIPKRNYSKCCLVILLLCGRMQPGCARSARFSHHQTALHDRGPHFTAFKVPIFNIPGNVAALHAA